MTGVQVGTVTCSCEESFHKTRFVAVTGGPGAGKTAVLEMALRSFCSHVGVLPEAAGIVFGGGFPRQADGPGRRSVQRAIFHVQREMERLVADRGDIAVALCDRGTLDGLAYWPDMATEYWPSIGTSVELEMARYDAVIHLRTPSAEQGYNNHTNRLRIETADEARAVDLRLLEAWKDHPDRRVIGSEELFLGKAERTLGTIRDLLPPCCQGHART